MTPEYSDVVVPLIVTSGGKHAVWGDMVEHLEGKHDRRRMAMLEVDVLEHVRLRAGEGALMRHLDFAYSAHARSLTKLFYTGRA